MKLYQLLIGLSQLSVAVIVLAACLGGWRYRGLSASQRRLAWLAGFDAAMELTATALSTTGHDNLFLYPVVLLGEMLLLLLLYQQVLQSAAFARALPWLGGTLLAGVAAETLGKLGSLHFYTGSQVVRDLLALLLAGLFFQKLLNELHVENLSSEPFFWVSAALAVHGLSDLLIALFSNYLQANYSLMLQQVVMLGARNVLNVVLYATYCLALWMRPPRLSS